jgi:glycosyltransferase involved in cell wall biosynthesis
MFLASLYNELSRLTMKIAFLSAMGGHPWGGSEILWSLTAKELKDSGHFVYASVKGWPTTPDPLLNLKYNGIHVDERHWQNASRARSLFAKIFRRGPVHPGWEPSWQRLIKISPDLVCISNGATLCGIEWMIRCRNSQIPYVCIAHANFEQWWPADRSVNEIRVAYEGAKKAFFVSKSNLSLFQRQIGITLPQAEIVSNPFNVSWNAQPEWPATQIFRLACVARYEPAAKGQDLLFQVLAMPKWRERELYLSLYGKGPWEESLRRLVEQEGISDKVFFCGHLEDVEEIWRTHHALVLPSRYEGLPLSIVEAMLCSRLSIITDVAGNSEVVEDNVTGYVAEAPTVRHLDEALERAWLQRNNWQNIGTAAGAAIRKIIPADPARVFAEKLVSLCK